MFETLAIDIMSIVAPTEAKSPSVNDQLNSEPLESMIAPKCEP